MAELIKRTDIFPLVRNVMKSSRLICGWVTFSRLMIPLLCIPPHMENTSCKESIITNIYKSQW